MTQPNKIRTYSELIQYTTFEDRLKYLKLDGDVGVETFGFDRYLNQMFYKSTEWIKLRNYIISRDHGCDLGIESHEIFGSRILVHHMNPITKFDIIHKTKYLLDPEYLITTIDSTHNCIHYGKELIICTPIIRQKNDTCLWKHK